jgi:hypothetical protein
LATVPDKRQESKQRRAARNRANREALAARRENAEIRATSTASRSSTASTSSKASGRGAKQAPGGAAPAAAPAPPPRGVMGMLQSRRPGDKAVASALGLAVLASIYLPFHQVPADDRGEPLPVYFRGAAIAAREQVIGADLPDTTVSMLDAVGPQLFLVLALPIAVAAFAVWANARVDRSRLLTFAMLAMAGAVILTGSAGQPVGIFYFPALIALAVGGFRVRKADLPARVAERAAAPRARSRGSWRGRAIDAESKEVVDDTPVDADTTAADDTPVDAGTTAGDDATADADPGDDGGVSSGAGDEVEYDPLAELEAELEAERDAGVAADTGDDAGDDDGPGGSGGRSRGSGRSRRRR